MKKLKGKKTVIYGALIALLAVFSGPEVQAFVAEHIPEVGGALGTGVIVLRALTNSSMFKSPEE